MASKNYVYELYGKILSLDVAQSYVAALLHLALTSGFGCMITYPSEMLSWVNHNAICVVECILRCCFLFVTVCSPSIF